MNLLARVVLDDCRGALEELKDGVQGAEWRRRWITAVVLLRAVGHVLDKVDHGKDKKIGAAIDKQWKLLNANKPEPRIFWDFIDQERNNILKEYAISAGQGVTFFLETRSATYNYVINSGFYAGRDQRDLILEAIEWWDNYLKTIEIETGMER